jgi:hypothetical protein
MILGLCARHIDGCGRFRFGCGIIRLLLNGICTGIVPGTTNIDAHKLKAQMLKYLYLCKRAAFLVALFLFAAWKELKFCNP